jgi:nucleotide-binding universal stress UspA family protein
MTTRILLAIDDSDHSRAASGEIVERMRPDDTTVHVLHVVELDRMLPPAFDFARGTGYGADIAAHVRQGREAAAALVSRVAEQLQKAGFMTATAVTEGDPRRAIVNYAAELTCDCIVMGSHGRRGVDRLFMGSVSESVVRNAHCSVYVVRLRIEHHV